MDKKELKIIAMNDNNHVFRVTKYKDLVKILDALLKESCHQGKFSSFFLLQTEDQLLIANGSQ